MWAIVDLPLTKPELLALLLIGRCNEITMTLLPDNPEVSENTDAGILSSLIQKGYAQKIINESDAEHVTVSLTPSGVAVAEHIKRTANLYIEHFTGNMKGQDRDKELFRELFSKFFASFGKADSENAKKSENALKKIQID